MLHNSDRSLRSSVSSSLTSSDELRPLHPLPIVSDSCIVHDTLEEQLLAGVHPEGWKALLGNDPHAAVMKPHVEAGRVIEDSEVPAYYASCYSMRTFAKTGQLLSSHQLERVTRNGVEMPFGCIIDFNFVPVWAVGKTLLMEWLAWRQSTVVSSVTSSEVQALVSK
jgi:hypothetical protein